MQAEGDQKKEGSEETAAETAPEKSSLLDRLKGATAGIGRIFRRPKHVLLSGEVKVIDAFSGVLQRLRKRAADSDSEITPAEGQDEAHEGREESRAKSKPREERSKAVEKPQEAVAEAHPHSTFHVILLYILVLIIGCVVGMIFSFLLLSTMVTNQAKKIDDQRDEISQLERQHTHLLESEAKYRDENKQYRQRISEFEAEEAAREAKEAAIQETAAAASGVSRARPGTPQKTGNCKLGAGNIDNNLNRCIEEFNRK
ncbi:MAG: hypothetical protein HY847_10820 [Betaproteobacteria bacterium]|nr:hypothetical protein [Betaproteobacteria bacterium]